LIFIVSRKRRK